jgi:hypothetical protein
MIGAQRPRDGDDPDAGARGQAALRLRCCACPLELKALFNGSKPEPRKSAHVMSLVAQCHGGKIYDSAWSKRMVGGGPYAEMLAARFVAPVAGSAIRRARRTCSTPAVSAHRRKRAISSRCSDKLPRSGRRARGMCGGGGVAREKRLEARDVEAIFRAFAEVLRELPPDTEAGFLDAEGDLRLAPDIGSKLRTARSVREVLRQIRQAENEREE